MKITSIKNQIRRDFVAVYECEHCGYTREGCGYDDSNFHHNVVPAMACKACGKTADKDYRPLTTKYPDDVVI